jgi:hypothetical protein
MVPQKVANNKSQMVHQIKFMAWQKPIGFYVALAFSHLL